MRLQKGFFSGFTIFSLCLVLSLSSAYPQYPAPPRFQIPGAILVDAPKPIRARARAPQAPQQQQQIYQEVRPVNEEPEEVPIRLVQAQQPQHVQHLIEVEPESEKHQSLPFRPERPLAVLRQDNQRQVQYAQPQQQPRPVIRQELKQQQNYAPAVEVPHLRRPQQQQQQQVRPAPRPAARPAPQYLDEEGHRTRKPPVQILRKYRTDNADGSITWGYENEDGSFKEENIGIDCITRGKYGYVDPDGVKREYSYETGGTCTEPEDDLEDLPPGQRQQQQQAPQKGGKKTYKLPAPQYVN